MNEKQLEYFVRIAELGSFRKASEVLHIAQPALTRQIQKAGGGNSALPCSGRGSKGIVYHAARPPPAGAGPLHPPADRTGVADVRAGRHRAERRGDIRRPASVAEILFARLSRTYLDLYPQVKLAFYEGVGHLRSWLLSGEIDLAILPNVRAMAERNVLHREPSCAKPVYVVGSARPLRSGRHLHLARSRATAFCFSRAAEHGARLARCKSRPERRKAPDRRGDGKPSGAEEPGAGGPRLCGSALQRVHRDHAAGAPQSLPG